MPRETFDIRSFNLGIISNADAEDIPANSASDSVNIDGDAPEGLLKGIPIDVEFLTSGSVALGNVRLGAMIESAGKYDLIYHDSSADKIIGISDFHSANVSDRVKADLITSNVSDTTVIIPNNKEVHIGTGYASTNVPKWVGYIGHGQFSNSAPTGLQVENAELTNYSGLSAGQFTIVSTTETEGSNPKPFITSNRYFWKFSLVYDGYQESPLSGRWSDVPDQNSEYYTIVIRADNAQTTPSAFNKRITGINLYRAEADASSGTAETLFRLVCFIDINDAGWTVATDDKTITIIDYGVQAKVASGTAKNFGNQTYEENTGIAETLEDSIVNYSLACKGNGYLFVGKCYKEDIPDADRYIFRSKELRFDMFDWVNDFLIMPEPISAMEFYEGKLYAFSLNKTYRINPEYMFIEDVFDDAGCQGQRAVHATEYGMFFANKQGAWVYRGGQINPISDAIKSGTNGWDSFTYTTLTDLIVTSDSKKSVILFINQATINSTPYIFAWAYNFVKGRWDALVFGAYTPNANGGVFKGRDGEVYLSIQANTYRLMRGATQRGWEWTSQKISFGETRQNKSLTMIKLDASGTVTITYGIDGATPSTSYTNESLINSYVKNVTIKLVANAGTIYARSLEVIFRRLYGKR